MRFFLLDNKQNSERRIPHNQEVEIMFASHNIKARSAFITATITAILIAISPNLHAQSPLTVQPSTGRVGVGNTSPTNTVDVTATVKVTTFRLRSLPLASSSRIR
jgi:hypothetical protein